MPVTIRYRFSQNFDAPPKQAYLWCTDFSLHDHQLMGYNSAERQVFPVADGIVLLKDIFHMPSGEVEKQKLVHLYPDRLSWFSTHVSGPNKYSQFRYEIVPQDGGSRLNYEALHVEYCKDQMCQNEVAVLAEQLCRADSAVWKLLAAAMKKELKS